MKTLWKSFLLATSMYSKLPTPRTEWSDKAMSYVFCFFPWIGLVVGGRGTGAGRRPRGIDRQAGLAGGTPVGDGAAVTGQRGPR